MSDKYCAHGFWLAKGCDECRDYERLVESQASDNAMIRDLTAKLQDAEAGIRLAEDWIDGLGRSLGLTRDDDGCWNMEGIEVTVDELRSRAEAAEAERDGANRRADLFREKLTDCESALHRAEAELQGIASVSTTDWDDPSDFKGWAQSRARYALLNNRRDHHAGLCQLVIPESGGHIESADCWCGPTVEEHPGGTLIIHNQTH